MSESEDFVQERQQKQMFLKEMILDPGHDTAKFSEYICSIRAGTNNKRLSFVLNSFLRWWRY